MKANKSEKLIYPFCGFAHDEWNYLIVSRDKIHSWQWILIACIIRRVHYCFDLFTNNIDD